MTQVRSLGIDLDIRSSSVDNRVGGLLRLAWERLRHDEFGIDNLCSFATFAAKRDFVEHQNVC